MKRKSPKQITAVKLKWRIRLMRCANIKKASQVEQQNQTTTTTTTKINCIKKLQVRFKKQNLITKSKFRQIKLRLNKTTCNASKKIRE